MQRNKLDQSFNCLKIFRWNFLSPCFIFVYLNLLIFIHFWPVRRSMYVEIREQNKRLGWSLIPVLNQIRSTQPDLKVEIKQARTHTGNCTSKNRNYTSQRRKYSSSSLLWCCILLFIWITFLHTSFSRRHKIMRNFIIFPRTILVHLVFLTIGTKLVFIINLSFSFNAATIN